MNVRDFLGDFYFSFYISVGYVFFHLNFLNNLFLLSIFYMN